MTNPPNDNEESAFESKVDYPESPVPGDDALPEDELPFTAFGQFGEGSLDIRVFAQDTYWVNRQGEPFLIEEMAPDYLSNVLEFLNESAEYFFVAMVNKTAVELLFMEGGPNLDASAYKLLRSMADVTHAEWMQNTVLVKKLNQVLVRKLNELLR